MIDKKVIIYNAPPNSGKDVAAQLPKPVSTRHVEFKNKLIELTCVIYSVTRQYFDSIYTRELKDTPMDFLFGLSPRQALIKVSEECIKPNYGADYFGKALATNIDKINAPYFECSDGGFALEIPPLYEIIKPENLLIVRVYRSGCDYIGDSRSYIHPQDVHPLTKVIDLYNNSTLVNYKNTVSSIALRFFQSAE